MTKSIHRHEYAVLLRLLKEHRKRLGLSQVECSRAIGRPQSFMSDVERGARRLDVVQLRDLCAVFNTDLLTFVKTYERALR